MGLLDKATPTDWDHAADKLRIKPLTQEELNGIIARAKAKADEEAVTESPLETQVGGSHYKDQGLQPFEITYANFGYLGLRAAVYNKVNKYLSRDKGTHKLDLEKAIHCLQVQLQFLETKETEDSL